MFTGIIGATALVKKNEKQKNDGGGRLAVVKPRGWRVKTGESVAVNGVCLTIISLSRGLNFAYMPETAACSTIENLQAGEVVNLEQALRLNDRLDGHIVQGHVDTIGDISSFSEDGDSHVLKITPRDPGVLRWVVEKGSVAVDGISLTAVKVAGSWFTVNILPFTWQETNLSTKKAEDKVNIEVDVLAKYVEKMYAGKK